MNNKGQTLVLFVILLPIFLMIFAYVFDTCYMSVENRKLTDIAEDSVRYLVVDKKDSSLVKEVIYKNDSDVKIVSVLGNNVHLKKDIKPVFGRIVGFDKYSLEVNITGEMVDGYLVLEEKGN